MAQRVAGIAAVIVLSVQFGLCQTAVTTTTGGSSGTVPVFTSNKNIENSAITQSNGNIGIGTTSPKSKLDTLSARAPQTTGIRVMTDNNGYAVGDEESIDFGWYVPYEGMNGRISGYMSDPSGWGSGGLKFYTNHNQPTFNAQPSMTLDSFGNVGIGTTTPSQPLEVNGNTKVDGTLTVVGTGGLDVQSGGIMFPDGTLQTTAYPASSSGGSAPIQVVNSEAVINDGVSANGSGIKHVRTNLSCTTGSHVGDTCTIAISWPGTPFADTNYTVTCIPKSVSGNWNSSNTNVVAYTLLIPDANKGPSAMNVVVENLVNSFTMTVTGLNCIAIHD